MVKQLTKQRQLKRHKQHRINEIYSSIKLPENTYFNKDTIFGDKRPYSYDADRSQASSKTFVVAKTVTETFNEIDAAIKAAGYTPFIRLTRMPVRHLSFLK